ncbi:MAG: hypothetical protein LR015_03255 [Verrucomicrobia bacterium]|nr:hypothetical protein [Verrucomicrobiota bacterium]
MVTGIVALELAVENANNWTRRILRRNANGLSRAKKGQQSWVGDGRMGNQYEEYEEKVFRKGHDGIHSLSSEGAGNQTQTHHRVPTP